MPIEKPVFCVPVDLGAIACGNQRANSPAIHLNLHKSPGLVWRSNGDADLWIRGKFAEAQSINLLTLLAANAQSGTKIRLRLGASAAEVDGAAAPYDSGYVDFIAPAETTDSGTYHALLRFPDLVAMWWRIDISGHSGDFEAADLVMGSAVQTGRFYDKGWGIGPHDLGDIEYSRWGVAAETDGVMLRKLDFNLSWVSEAEYKAGMKRILFACTRQPVFLLFNPEPASGRQEHFYFGRFGQPPFAVNSRKPQHFGMEFTMLSWI